ncbi:hypothetical protein I3842_09G168100 [Carya illinoinensis]|uniref:valine--tRNA ligase n=2 Tax=Carya illinoinensis TaxID=32201 RepID=A0A922J7Z8_CARIL|nr:hypothetical protein I3842_09G168100 [Carya illinoinensis]
MMLHTLVSSSSSLFSPYCSSASYRLNPLLVSKPRRGVKLFPRWHFSPFRIRPLAAAAATENGVFTSPEMAKAFDFTSEERIYNWWESQGYFRPNFDQGSDPFVISMPPPNVTGSLHMGHAMFVTLEDIMVRYHRMKGRPTLWLPGTDHAGIATQLVVERMLASEGIKRVDLSRDEFTNRVWEWKEKFGGTIANQIRRLGASCDWTREHFTLDEQLSRAVIEAFVRLHEKGLIYQGSYLVNWSPNLQTAVSDLEVEYSEESGTLYHIKYRVAGSDYLTIATTRPETLFGDVAIAVHPKDDRYSKYIGMMAIVPMTYGRHVPIISDRQVDKDFGTGVLKISPGHDHNDYLLARKLGLPILNVMNKDGTLNEVAGLYCGLDRFEARKKLWADLEETGLAVKKQPHTLRVPRSQRGGEIIEPLVSRQWFVSMEPLAEKALLAVEKGELSIIPERFEKIYNHWLSNIKDWCISRQLWWGHRIPVWYIVGKDFEEEYIVARSADEAREKACQKYGKDVEIYQDPDVLDTWFSSALWPFSTLGWPDVSAEDFKRFYPTTMLETGHDILFFWVARMVMMGIEFTGTIPFSYIYLHGLIRDSQVLDSGKTIGSAKMCSGLYLLEVNDPPQGTTHQSACSVSSSPISLSVSRSTNDSAIMLWHYRLGHPNFLYLEKLFPSLFHNKNPNEFQCEVCQFSKHIRNSYPNRSYKASQPFSMIHSDVWGPSRIKNVTGSRWFISFIDDHTRLTWVFLMKEKSETNQIFKTFNTMIQTQFQAKIKILKTDNAKEYFNSILNDYLLSHGIVHQSSCVNTPQQNGIAERKNRHLLDVARSLMFSTHVPKFFWGEAILTAAYLINRMPSRILNFQTPCQILLESFPNTRLISTIPFKVFGCSAFVHVHQQHRDKLDPRALKCIFLGYSPTQKGYKCYSPVTKQFYHSMDVTFFEQQPYFPKSDI